MLLVGVFLFAPTLSAFADAKQLRLESINESAINLNGLEREFAQRADLLGLSPINDIKTVAISDKISRVTSMAMAQFQQNEISSTFFLREDRFIIKDMAGQTHTIASHDISMRNVGDRFTVDLTFKLPPSFDKAVGFRTGIAGLQITRTSVFDLPGLLELLESGDQDAIQAELHRLTSMTQNLTETVTVTRPDGTRKTYPAEQFNIAEIMGFWSCIQCIIDCFADWDISWSGAGCVAAFTAVCALVCGLPPSPACVTCIETALTTCDFEAAIDEVDALVECLVGCLFDKDAIAQGCPSLTEYGLIALAVLLMIAAIWMIRKRRIRTPA